MAARSLVRSSDVEAQQAPVEAPGSVTLLPAAPRVLPDPMVLLRELRDERVLRVEILKGAVCALAQVLAVADPVAYTQALRVQKLALELAATMDMTPCWELESAAVLAPLGGLSLAADLHERASESDRLDADERHVLATLPGLTDRMLAPVPGLEEVRTVHLLWHDLSPPSAWVDSFGESRMSSLRRMAAVLRISGEFEALLGRGLTTPEALGLLSRNDRLRPEDMDLLMALDGLHRGDAARVEIRSLPLSRLRTGLVMAEALYTSSGQLLVRRGFEITPAFLERVACYRAGVLREPIAVILPRAGGVVRNL
ncbi:MAG: HD domain-containing phosphohydrolase [Panacagrimonas sp.]